MQNRNVALAFIFLALVRVSRGIGSEYHASPTPCKAGAKAGGAGLKDLDGIEDRIEP